jgi:hypothetical protein
MNVPDAVRSCAITLYTKTYNTDRQYTYSFQFTSPQYATAYARSAATQPHPENVYEQEHLQYSTPYRESRVAVELNTYACKPR